MKTITMTMLAGIALAASAMSASADSLPRQERYQIADGGAVERTERPARIVRHRQVERRTVVRTARVPVVSARSAIPQDCWAPVHVKTRVLAPPTANRAYGGDTDTNAVGFIFGLGPDSPASGQYQNIPSKRGHDCRN